VIFAEPIEAANTAATRRVYLRCACGRCDRLFAFRVPNGTGK
jgi:hypothetical protein